MQRLASVNFSHFHVFKYGWRDLLQSCHKCSLSGPDQVLLLFKQIRNPKWPPWPLIGWHIFNFFSRTAEGIYSKLATPVFYEVPNKCCYFLSRSEIQYGHPSLFLADTFSTSQERLKGSAVNLTQMVLIRSWPSVVTFKVDLKSKMAAWPLIVWHIFNFFWRMAAGIYSKLATLYLTRS